ncbi:MAG: hypothetical protein JJ900_15745 [Rhodospirillales bacterium]|nr:hypothetical protein [Rhodospirillales bacterium]MBO6788301.1 hypothetical protein [Rhodospirillales bacterium]
MNRPFFHPPVLRIEDARAVAEGPAKDILDIWDHARRGKFAPRLGKDFHLDDLGFDRVPCISVVDVLGDSDDYFYRFWGTQHTDVKGLEMSGKRLSECPLPGVIERGRTEFPELIRRRVPTAFIYEHEHRSGPPRAQTTCRFPLSTDGETVDGILSYQDLDNKTVVWDTFYERFWGGKKPEMRIGVVEDEF